MPSIHILDDRLVGQIAAGEVVERPASVVKELVENALDAGATEVRIELEAGGKRLIRVIDDGHGMDRDDVLLAFDRHATSKIASFEDLQRVSTLGFRGEALSSIAAVAKVTLTSAPGGGDGHRVRIEGGRVRDTRPAPHPPGTGIDVAALFYNVPARRKFLKSTQTELRRALEVVQGYALARPEVGFQLAHEGRVLLDAPAAGRGADGARGRIAALFGSELAAALVELPEGGGGGARVAGFVGRPETCRGRRTFTFVNGRLVRDRALMGVFYRAVREEWRSEDFPALFLFLEVPANEVDVNVHPQKTEVRFRHGAVFDRVGAALRAALRRGLGEGRAPLGLAGEGPSAPLAWRGGEVREGLGAAPGGAVGRLAEAVFAPLERRPIPLGGRSGEARPFRLLGQYKGALILLEGPDGLYLVDQHVAHERVLFERFERQIRRRDTPSQGLLEPILLELAGSEALRLGELVPELEARGFELARLSGGTLALKAAPSALGAGEAEALLLRLAAGEDDAGADELTERMLSALAASRSCRAAVKMHHPLTPAEMEALIGDLFDAEQPFVCPHGRPIVLKMSDLDLETRFKRR